MITIRHRDERGDVDFGWLRSKHSFSFGHYYDPQHMGFRSLRVINEDRVAPGGGFDEHGHGDMEIISYVLDGALEHKDSLGTGAVIRPGEVQIMSAGTGIRHSEFNHSDDEPVHFLQMWVLPRQAGIAPRYDQREFPASERRNTLRLVVSPDGSDGALGINADVSLYAGLLDAGASVTHSPAPGRYAWVQAVRGAVTVNGQELEAGDGAAISDEAQVDIIAVGDAEVLVYDLA